MAMSGATLKTAIVNGLIAAGYPQSAESQAIWGVVAGAIVTHIGANAELSVAGVPGVTGATAVTAGVGASDVYAPPGCIF